MTQPDSEPESLVSSIPGLDNISSLQITPISESVRVLFSRYVWPELKCIHVSKGKFPLINQTLETLRLTAPELAFVTVSALALKRSGSNTLVLPALSELCALQIDWGSLPWQTTLRFFLEAVSRVFDIDVQGKCLGGIQLPVQFFLDWKITPEQPVEVDFSRNELSFVPNLQFAGCSYASVQLSLNLSHNSLHSTEITQAEGPKDKRDCPILLHALDFSHNDLFEYQADQFLKQKDLRELHLHHNRYRDLPKHFEGECEIAKKCSLSEEYVDAKCKTTKMCDVFTLFDLTKLEFLDLSSNLLDIDRVSYFFFQINEHTTLQEIALRHSNWTTFPVLSTITTNTYTCKHEKKAGHLTRFNKNLVVDLRFNFITSLGPPVSSIIRYSDFMTCDALFQFVIDVGGNPINCSDPNTVRTYEYFISGSKSEELFMFSPGFSFYEENLKCTTPPDWSGIPLFQLSELEVSKLYTKPFSGFCPPGCYCYHSWIFGDINVANCTPTDSPPLTDFPQLQNQTLALSYLVVAHNKLETLCTSHPENSPALVLAQITSLDASWNVLHTLCGNFLLQLTNLQYLNLGFNQIPKLPKQIWELRYLRELDLTSAGLEELPIEFYELELLSKIHLHSNYFRCDCDTFWMRSWLTNHTDIVKESQSLLCFSGKGKGKRIAELTQDDVGCYDSLKHKKDQLQTLLLAVSGTCISLFLSIFVLHKYKGYIKVWLYAHFNIHPWDKVKENMNEKDYDAFISYFGADPDEHWVHGTLVPYLEAPQCGFHLSIHQRDFVPGIAISKNITMAIEYSRRTILVLSPNFLQSGWCDFEFQNAHRRVLEDRSNYLIIVLLAEIDTDKIDKLFKFYLETRTYLDVKDKNFWNKLLYLMPTVPIDKLKAAQRERENQEALGQVEVVEMNDRAPQNGDEVDGRETDPLIPHGHPLVDDLALPPLFRRVHTYIPGVRKKEEKKAAQRRRCYCGLRNPKSCHSYS